jgi:hypothetical protein
VWVVRYAEGGVPCGNGGMWVIHGGGVVFSSLAHFRVIKVFFF